MHWLVQGDDADAVTLALAAAHPAAIVPSHQYDVAARRQRLAITI